MNRTAGQIQIRDRVVKEARQGTHHAALALTLFAKKQDVVSRQQGKADFGDHGVLVTQNAGKEICASRQELKEVVSDFCFDRSRFPAAGLKFCQCCGAIMVCGIGRLRHQGSVPDAETVLQGSRSETLLTAAAR